MKLNHNNKLNTGLIILGSLLIAWCIAGRGLFSLPVFYEQLPGQKWHIFLLSTFVLFLFVFFASKAFILPYVKTYSKPKDFIFILLIFIILTGISFISTTYYWAKPEKHSIEICFDAEDGKQQLEIHELIEPVTKRLYPPKSFGTDRYPIILQSGTCRDGSIVTLYWKYHLLLFSPGLTAVVQQRPPDGRFFMSINDTPAVIMFDEQNNSEQGNEVNFTDGLESGEVLSFAKNMAVFTGFKVLLLLITAAYLSFFFFGLTEKFIHYEKKNTN